MYVKRDKCDMQEQHANDAGKLKDMVGVYVVGKNVPRGATVDETRKTHIKGKQSAINMGVWESGGRRGIKRHRTGEEGI